MDLTENISETSSVNERKELEAICDDYEEQMLQWDDAGSETPSLYYKNSNQKTESIAGPAPFSKPSDFHLKTSNYSKLSESETKFVFDDYKFSPTESPYKKQFNETEKKVKDIKRI